MIARSCVLLALLAGAATAQYSVRVVDGDGGAEFSDVQAAVAAADPGDVVLVRESAASYAPFAILGKALTVTADAGAQVLVDGLVLVADLGPQDSVVLRGLDAQGIAVADVAGEVWIEEAVISGHSPGLSATNCQRLVLRDLDLDASAGGRGLELVDTVAVVFESEVHGGDGGPGAPGGDALAATGGVVWLVGGRYTGGAGGDANPGGPCSAGGDGGHALLLGAGSPEVRVQDSTLDGGAGGAPSGGSCAAGSAGQPWAITSGDVLSVPGPVRSLHVTSPVREDEFAFVTMKAMPGEEILLYVSVSTDLQMNLHYNGVLVTWPFVVLPLFPLVIPASGVVTLPGRIPELGPGIEGLEITLQAAYCGSGPCKLGSASMLIALDQGL